MTAAVIVAAPVERDADGSWWHPGMPDFEEGQEVEWKAWLDAQCLQLSRGMLEDEDLDHPVYVDYFDNGNSSFLAWVDEPPAGEGWFTLAICDTEDGPAWTWARRAADPAKGAK